MEKKLGRTIRTMGGIVENVLLDAEKELVEALERFGEIRVSISFKLTDDLNGKIGLDHRISFVKEKFENSAKCTIYENQANLFESPDIKSIHPTGTATGQRGGG